MSKGSKVVPVRVPPLLLSMMDKTIVRLNKRRKDAPFTRSSFLLTCVLDKFDHLERSLRSSRSRSPGKNGSIISQSRNDQTVPSDGVLDNEPF